MNLFTDEQKVKALNEIIREIAKCSDFDLLNLMNHLHIKNNIDEKKLLLVMGRGGK